MKKMLSVLVILTVLAAFIPHSADALQLQKLTLSADKASVEMQGTVTFTCRAYGASYSTSMYLTDESKKALSAMYDDGTHGDGKAHDGIYSCRMKLSSDKMCTKKYYAVTANSISYPVNVKFRQAVSSADIDYANALWDKIEKYESYLASEKKTKEEIMSAVYLLVKGDSHIYSIEKNSRKSFSFMLDSGIECYFEHFGDVKSPRYDKLPMRDASFIQKSTIGVWSPFFGADPDFTESYLERAQEMAREQGYDSVDAYYGESADLASFSSFDKYGIIMIDSHGAEYNGGGYICVPNVTDYDDDDVADGLIVMSGKTALISGAYIAKYTDELPNSIIYIGICNGMQADNFYAPLLNHGAGFIAGFDESVSFTFDDIIMNDFCMRIASQNPDTGMQYSAGSAYKACILCNGSTDIYASPRAHFVWHGDPDVVAAAIEVPVESVSFSEESVTLYHNNTYAAELVMQPENANRMVRMWRSDDDSIVTVDDNGTLTVGNSDGTAHILCTVTDTAGGEERVFTAEMEVIVAGAMPVQAVTAESSRIDISTGELSYAGAYVLPENASEQGIIYSSLDESIVQTDEYGRILPISVGDTYVRAESAEGGFFTYIAVSVHEGDMNYALNRKNGAHTFSADGSYLPEITSEDGRLCVKSTNIGKMNSASTVTLAGVKMNAGDTLVFDWKVSCERIYDSFRFAVNGEIAEEISGLRDWHTMTYEAKEDGVFMFKWIYQKDYSTNDGDDCAWIDNIDIIRRDEVHTVTFTDADGEILEVQTVAHGGAAQAPHNDNELVVCEGWDADFTEVRSDMIVKRHDIMHGDCNYDGTINTGDAVVVLRICAELIKSDMLLDTVCDFNGDSIVNTGDATAILKYVVMR